MTIKYLVKRGSIFQFSRRVPDDVRRVIGTKHWRWSLKTDSKIEAEIVCRRHAVETDDIIERVRNGTYRRFTDTEIDDLAIRWGMDFQLVNRENTAASVFPDVITKNDPIGDEEQNPIFASRQELESSVVRWVTDEEPAPSPGSADWERLVDACLDEYLVGNPELSDGWVTVLAERGLDFSQSHSSYLEVVQRPQAVTARNRLSAVFEDFLSGDHGLARGTVQEYQLSVDRFVTFHGDLDINEITKEQVKEFRDLLRKVPSRPPDDVRRLPLKDQVAWAEGQEIATLSQAAINKNFLGVKAALTHAHNETSILRDPHWRNPFDGFSRKAKKPKNPVKRFTNHQIDLVFSSELYQPKTAEKC